VSPDTTATLLILFSALLHAVVNAIVKSSDDGLLTRGCMNAMALAVAAPFVFLVSWPSPELWGILVLAMLIHGLYPFFLVGAYRDSDLSAVFPVARGTAPLGVAVLAVAIVGEAMSWAKFACIGLISVGVASFAFERGVLSTSSQRRGMALAVMTGIIIAVYTIIDGIGLRVAESKMTYIVWLFVLDGAFVSASVALVRNDNLVPFLRRNWKSALLGGVLGVITYGLALFALGLGVVAEIAALRETSIVFAALIGALLLKEAFGPRRMFAAVLVAVGVIALQLTR
jgi:drug/metabolite transporter (DMT)-like permease